MPLEDEGRTPRRVPAGSDDARRWDMVGQRLDERLVPIRRLARSVLRHSGHGRGPQCQPPVRMGTPL